VPGRSDLNLPPCTSNPNPLLQPAFSPTQRQNMQPSTYGLRVARATSWLSLMVVAQSNAALCVPSNGVQQCQKDIRPSLDCFTLGLHLEPSIAHSPDAHLPALQAPRKCATNIPSSIARELGSRFLVNLRGNTTNCAWFLLGLGFPAVIGARPQS
jgi:hypothetical protein